MTTPATAWSLRGNLRGPEGPAGPVGPAGPDGGTTPHAFRHATGGDDPLTPAAIGAQSLDADLTTIAALAPADGAVLRRIAGTWSTSTIAEVKAALALAKADVGLSSVDDTADAAKPVSTAQQTALDLKLDASARGTPGGVAELVGSVIPRSRYQYATTTLDGTIVLAGDLGGTATSPTVPGLAARQPLDADLTAIAALAPADGAVLRRVAGAWSTSTIAEVKTALALAKADVGLGSVDNTADSAKPVSTPQATALSAKKNVIEAYAVKTGAYTLVDTDEIIVGDTSAGSFTLTLPTAVGRTGRSFLIKKIGPNALTIGTTSSQTIDGVATEPISMAYGFREVVSNGANWYVRGGKVDPVIAALADTAAAGTLTINAAAATIYRGRLTGATATLAAPTNPIDGDVVNVELYATVACALTIAAAIVPTSGITSPINIPAGKLWSGGLRYRAATSPVTSAAAWRLLASSLDN